MVLFMNEPAGLEGINAFYERELLPHLRVLERRRRFLQANADKFYVTLLLFILTGVLFMLAVFGAIAIPFVAVGVFFLIRMASKACYGAFREAKGKHKLLVIEKLSEFLGLEYWEAGIVGMAGEHGRLSLLPDYDRAGSEDGFAGSERGLGYRLTEIHLEKSVQTKELSRWMTVYRGILVKIDIAKKFSGTTILLRNKSNIFGQVRDKVEGMSLVSLEATDFTDRFTVLSTDQVEARFLLTPSAMARLLEIESSHRHMVAAFYDGTFHMAFPADDSFEVGHPGDDLTNPALLRSAIRDLVAVRNLAAAMADLTAARV